MTVIYPALSQKQKDLIRDFSDLTLRVSWLLAPDYDVRAFDGDGPKNYATLDLAQQVEVLEKLRNFSELCLDIKAAGYSLSNDRRILWRILSKMRLRPADDLFENIADNDLIEIYDQQNVQIFRNFFFFKVCSYTLDDLLCRPWWELFKRDMSIIDKIMKISETIYRVNSRDSVFLNLAVHTVDEVSSLRRYHAVAENKILSPLVDKQGKVTAIVNVVRVHSCRAIVSKNEPKQIEGGFGGEVVRP